VLLDEEKKRERLTARESEDSASLQKIGIVFP
jgi:hypothetical protein